MIAISFNGCDEDIDSIEAFSLALDRYDGSSQFELWLSLAKGPSMCMLRNGEYAFLMYLRSPADPGFVSGTAANVGAEVQYMLSNGQIDEYPQAWCVPVEQCYKALAYFFVNDGQRPKWIAWHDA